MINGVKEYKKITDNGLTIINKEGDIQVIEADTIVPVVKLAPNIELLESLEGVVPEVYPIGDCKGTYLIVDAISAGLKAARSI